MNRRQALKLGGAALAGMLAAACAPKDDGEIKPPEIQYGFDMCAVCGMVIDQPRHAAATVTVAGAAHKFDDIGDMVRYHSEHPTEQPAAWFVHDSGTEAWLRAETAWFVMSGDLGTPMGHGVAAFAARADAEAVAQAAGAKVLSFDETRAALVAMDHSQH